MKLKKITMKKAREMGLAEVGKAYGENLSHSVYLMQKYCEDRKKVKFYSIEFSVINEKSGRGRQIVRFWKK